VINGPNPKEMRIMLRALITIAFVNGLLAGVGAGANPAEVHPFVCGVIDQDPNAVIRTRPIGVDGERYNVQTQLAWQSLHTWTEPGVVTFSFPPDGLLVKPMTITGTSCGGSAHLPNVLGERLADLYGSAEEGRDAIRAAFASWNAVCGVKFTEVSDDGAPIGARGSPTRGDIRVVAVDQTCAGAAALVDLSLGTTLIFGDAVFSAEDHFEYVALHETGHTAGLHHVTPADGTKVMEAPSPVDLSAPQHDDIRGVQAVWGDRFEPNDAETVAAVVDDAGVSWTLLSLDEEDDEDWFVIELSSSADLSVAATPDGFEYDIGWLGQSVTTIDSSEIQDLEVAVFNSSLSLIAQATGNGFGAAESVGPLSLSAGVYYIRIQSSGREGSAIDHVQLYDLEIEVD
jgi:hypothetical protein